MQFIKFLFIGMLLTACHTSNTPPKPKVSIDDKVKVLTSRYHLTQYGFDAECIYQQGDLTKLLTRTLTHLLPEEKFTITEVLSADRKRYVATVTHSQGAVIQLYADTHADFLPEGYTNLLDAIPAKIGSSKTFAMINPRLTGQAAWYICGTKADLLLARKEGLPLVFPGEDVMEADLSGFE